MRTQRPPTVLFLVLLVLSGGITSAGLAADRQPVQVFVLAGQSNMQGQGVVDLDHPKYYNGGKGTLLHVMRTSETPELYRHLQDTNGEWVVRDDVLVRYRVENGVKSGGLSIGFTGYPGKHHIGPELQFGHLVGDHLSEPVLLIKTAWGGKSLFKDFRPPSAGGETGEFYLRMMSEVEEALEALPKEFPQLAGRKTRMAGFVWQQGWNDMFQAEALAEYEQNLVYLVQDVRKAWKSPRLPIVIGELGNGGAEAGEKMIAIRVAQAAAATRVELRGRVAFASTTAFARPANQSPNVGHGHHWFGNAESYFLIGDALGNSMIKLLKRRR